MRCGAFLLCLLAATAGLAVEVRAPVEIRLRLSDRGRLEELSRLVSISDVRGAEVRALASPRQLERLAAAGFVWTVVAPEKAAAVAMCPAGWEQNPGRSWGCYPSYDQYVGLLEVLAAGHPTLCRTQSLGDTANLVRPHELWAMHISRDPEVEEDEPEVLLSSTLHGDEASGMVLLLRLIDELLEGYGADPEITGLVDSTEIWILPDSNPDGTYFAGDDTVSGAVRFYTTSSGGISYVDPNRNFPDPAEGAHPDGNPRWPETGAMMAFAAAHSITLAANLHDGSEVVNYPWDTWQRPHPDEDWFNSLARAWADRAQQDGPAGYMRDQNDGITNGYAWYPVHGGLQDYLTYFRSGRALTVELSHDKTPPGDDLEELWQANRRAFLGFIAAALQGLRGVITGPGGEPLAATVELVGHDTAADASAVATDPDVGDFHRLLTPGIYDVRITAPGFKDLEMGGITVTGDTPTILDATLEPEGLVTVSGRVTAAFTGQPISGAAVEIVDSELGATTDDDGRYTIDEVPAGEQTLHVTAAGFAGASVAAEVRPPAATVDVTLRPLTLHPRERFAPGVPRAPNGARPHGQGAATRLR